MRHIGKSKGFGEARAAGLNGVGWRASARSALLVGKDPNTGELAICQNKNNLAPKSQKSFGFKIETTFVDLETGDRIEVGKFFWTGESKLTERQMLSTASTEDAQAEQSEAVTFLREALHGGPRPVKDVKREASSIGLSEQNLRTARTKLGVIVSKQADSFDSSTHFWTWELPFTEGVRNELKDVRKKGNPRLCSKDTNKTSYGNDLTEDVSSPNKHHLRDDKSTPSVERNTHGKLFEDSVEPNEPPNNSKPFNYECWSCKTNVSSEDSRCVNCEQNLNETPF